MGGRRGAGEMEGGREVVKIQDVQKKFRMHRTCGKDLRHAGKARQAKAIAGKT